MKKFIRYLRLRRQSPADHDEHMKRKQRYEADFTLEPFAGLTPEYMEMSERGRAWREGARGGMQVSEVEQGTDGGGNMATWQPPGASLTPPPHGPPPALAAQASPLTPRCQCQECSSLILARLPLSLPQAQHQVSIHPRGSS